jgi:serine/threonine-protein kinase
MRYVEGGDLAKLLRRQGSLPPERALALLRQVADALDAAHEAGLVHRDVKPANVLLAREHCYLSDFGLARESTARSGVTDSGQIVGTVDYVAPEVVAGGEITAKADLYALGCVLFEVLAGVPPFRRDSEFAVLWSHVNEPPPKLGVHQPELAALDGVVARALAKDPVERYPSGRALVEAASATLPVSVVAPPSRRRRRVVLAVGVLGAAVAAVAVSLALGGGGQEQATPTLTPRTSALQRIDPRTNEVVATIPVAVQSRLVTTGGGSVWAANAGENRLFRIDPSTNAVVQTIETVNPRGLGYGDGELWVLNSDDGIVTRFDATTGAPAEVIPLPPGTGLAEVDSFVMVAGDSVWVQWVVPVGNIVRVSRHSGAAEAATIGLATIGKITKLARSGRATSGPAASTTR